MTVYSSITTRFGLGLGDQKLESREESFFLVNYDVIRMIVTTGTIPLFGPVILWSHSCSAFHVVISWVCNFMNADVLYGIFKPFFQGRSSAC